MNNVCEICNTSVCKCTRLPISRNSTPRAGRRLLRWTLEPEYSTSPSPSPESVLAFEESEGPCTSTLDECARKTSPLLQSLRIKTGEILSEFNDSETLGSNGSPKASDLLTENHKARKGMVYHNFSSKHRLLAAQANLPQL
ncbi:uncharacterized protein LOC122576872 [Bombus pyrosoma]|uniref:uncharacterized protein LOC122576872 n=1 Tax=Bombus pyrosoma TaxID=396416 RepID=UPI001CB9BBE9|nr:uncharacterized protein LOC122576872 [Bombus pyrosoma]